MPGSAIDQRVAAAGACILRVPFTRPFNWPRLLAFFALRATPGVECVAGNAYRRSISIGEWRGTVEVAPKDGDRGDTLRVILRGAHARDEGEVLRRLREIFDVAAPAGEIDAALGRDARLRPLLAREPGIRVPGAWDGFELTVRAILGQQVSVKGATTLAGRVAERYGEPLGLTGTLTRIFPRPERLRRARFNGMGIIGSRADTIRRVAAAVASGDLSFKRPQDPAEFHRALCAIRGIGDWTAQYVAMRVMRNPDAFPATDLGLLKSFAHPRRSKPAELLRRAEAWRPWRAYAAMLLWASPGASGG
jgi:AraC family transcriptional regulator, regulatory protein of adaptative response / DNA-3-methyladenine glycosylase II